MKHRFKSWLAHKIFKNEFEKIQNEIKKVLIQNENLKEQIKYLKLELETYKYTVKGI